jgi:hypothetical protein
LFILPVTYDRGESWWNDDVNRGKLLIHPPELSSNPEASGSKKKEWAKGMRI